MKKNWMQIVTLGLCAVLLVLILRQGGRIERLENQLDSQSRYINDILRDDIRGISDDVRRELEESTRLAVDYALTPAGLDRAAHSLLAEVSVTLRQWGGDTRAALLVRTGGGTAEVPLTHTGNGVFTGPVSLPGEGREEIALDLAATTGGVTTRESLGSWADVSMLLPLSRSGWGGPAWETVQDGVLTLSPYLNMSLDGQNGQNIPVNDPAYRLYRNGRLVLERPAALDPNDVKEGWYSYYLMAAPGTGLPETEQVTVPCAPGDDFLLTFACADDYGLAYEFTHTRWTVSADGEMEETWQEGDEYPALTWE